MTIKLFVHKKDCCGCGACANACQLKIIEMKADEEGFLYPTVTDSTQCIHCGLCEKVCPIKNTKEVPDFKEDAVAGYTRDQKEIKASASGGLATAMAKGFINAHSGVVYGVAYAQDCSTIEYVRVENAVQLEELRTSKYAQAQKNNVYQKVKDDLHAGRPVLFFGLPCDAYALQLYLGKPHENLYVCALMCHGPTSPAVHTAYTAALVNRYKSKIMEFSVRYKKDGWKPYYIRAKFNNGAEHIERFDSSLYGIAFLYLKRPSCNVCQIKRSKIHSDITIGDYHLSWNGRGQFRPYHPDGVSSAIIHTRRGVLLTELAKNFCLESIPVKNVLYSEAYVRPIAARANRREFGRVFAKEGLEAACGLASIRRIESWLTLKGKLYRQGAKVKRILLRNR